VKAGGWTTVSDLSAAAGVRLYHTDAGVPKVTAPFVNPPHYFEMSFNAEAGRPYRLWIRAKAQDDFWGNDSVWVQFSDSVNSSGGAVYRIGTTTGTEINLEDCSGCGLSGWGWQDNGWGVGVFGPQIFFQTTGTHTIRVQGREDGISIDQIVLSPGTYLNNSPGALKNDNTVLPASSGGGPPPQPAPAVSSISPNSGPTSGGTSVTIAGSNFASGATVTFDSTAATNVNVVSSTTITAVAPTHAAGPVNVTIVNPSGLSGTLPGGYTYTAPTSSETILLADDFNDNSLDLAKWSPNNLFSGFTDAAVPAREISQALHVGSLFAGQANSHYNGLRSANTYNFAGAYSYVELVQAPVSTTKADAMFTIGRDADNYYRIYVEEGIFICQAKIGGAKRTLFSSAYSSAVHRYWRIRHDQATGNVVFETSGDLAGSWLVRYSEQWNAASVPLTAVVFEIKAGTWQPESVSPGTVIFDNFKLARP
jgi:hypothetical protein